MNHHRFEAHNKHALINDERASEQPADEIISMADIRPSDVVADLGCGNGYIAIPLTERAGLVLALDVSKEMLLDLMSRSNERQHEKLRPIQCELPELPLRTSSVDHVIMVNVLHEFEDKDVMVKETIRVLRRGGRVTIVDFQKKATMRGPPMEIRIDESAIPALFGDFDLVAQHSYPSYYRFQFSKAL